jgi:hypothetical protein
MQYFLETKRKNGMADGGLGFIRTAVPRAESPAKSLVILCAGGLFATWALMICKSPPFPRPRSPGRVAGFCLVNIRFRAAKPARAKITYLGDEMMIQANLL